MMVGFLSHSRAIILYFHILQKKKKKKENKRKEGEQTSVRVTVTPKSKSGIYVHMHHNSTITFTNVYASICTTVLPSPLQTCMRPYALQ